ncbi:MAG: ATP-binding cassette domain-containing protein [Planctomycetota bacterium]|nr:ATP-binding cassette domain-containing protein [Planctomycetota bacterium]
MTRSAGVDLVLQAISRSFGARQVLRGLTGRIAAGEFVAIVGRSGSGKSTLLRLMAGLDRPDSGRIEIGGRPVAGVVDCMRMTFQEGRLLPCRPVLDNVGLADRHHDWPARLSGGQRQRVALARALAADPQLLLLDEPLGSLDVLTRLEMQQLIERLWREQRFTAVLISHDVEEAVTLADRVWLLQEGEFRGEWQIPLPRPRLRSNAAVIGIVEEILARLLRPNE